MKNQQPKPESEFKAEEIDKRYEMDTYSVYNPHDGSYTYYAPDGHSSGDLDALNASEAKEHEGISW